MFIEPNIESSYLINNKGKKIGEPYYNPKIGQTLYDYVVKTKPKVIVEFGVLFGYSTICMAQALRDIGCGGIISKSSADEKLRAGANLLQVYTGLVYKGLQLIKQINN